MRVVVGERMGGPEVLAVADRDAPRPGPGEVVVEVAAAGVNYMDIYQREGVGNYRTDRPSCPARKARARSSPSGPTSRTWPWAIMWPGPARGAVTPNRSRGREPRRAGTRRDEPAGRGAAILQGMTAHYLCTSTYPVREGDITVVHAAAGGVGLLLTQMVKRRGGVSSDHLGRGEGRARAAGRRRSRRRL
jgi:NADPH:quinone reductase and related Zn-dependent oxidoreductases